MFKAKCCRWWHQSRRRSTGARNGRGGYSEMSSDTSSRILILFLTRRRE